MQGTFLKKIKLITKFKGRAEIEDLKTVIGEDADGNKAEIVISRTSELKIYDVKSGIVLSTNVVPYGSQIFIKNKDIIEKPIQRFVSGILTMVLLSLSLLVKLNMKTSNKVLLIR